MATTRNLSGPRVLLASDNGTNLYLTYVIESQNLSAGTTTIRYSIFDTPWYQNYSSYSPIEIGDMISTPAVTYYAMYRKTNPETGSTYDFMDYGPLYPETMVASIASSEAIWDEAYARYYYNYNIIGHRWLITDIYLVVNSLDTYDLSVQILGWHDLTVAQTTTISLSDHGIITMAPIAFTDEASPTVQYINPLGSAVAELQVGILDSSMNEILVPYRDANKTTSGSYTFRFTESELNSLYSYLLTTTNGPVYFALKTTIDGVTNVSTSRATLSLVDYRPEMAAVIKDINEKTVALTGNNQKFIKYYSTANFAVNAVPRKGARIVSYKTTHNNAIYRGVTGTVNNVETTKFVLSATDTRNITISQTLNISMLEYVKLTCNLSADLPSGDDTIQLTVSGNYWNDSFGAQDNTLTIQYRYKSNTNDTFTEWGNATRDPSFNGNTYRAIFDINVPNHVDIYTLQVRAIDKLATIESKTVSVQSFPIFDWDVNDFNFNVPVSIQDDLSVAGTIYQNGNPMVDFIVDQGTSGIWTYRKWASGIAECWGTIAPAAHNITTAWGSIYTKDNAIARQVYPFTFTEDPVVSMTLHNPTGNCWSFTGTPGGVSLSPAFGLARGTSGSVTVGARISAIGRWK